MGLNQSPFRVLFHLGFAINKNESSPSLQFCAQHILVTVRKIGGEKKQEKIEKKKRGEKNL